MVVIIVFDGWTISPGGTLGKQHVTSLVKQFKSQHAPWPVSAMLSRELGKQSHELPELRLHPTHRK